jgi:hypothetical protein
LRAIVRLAAVAGISAALVMPAVAQFWNPFSSSPRQQQRQAPQRQQFNPFNNWWGGGAPREERPRHQTRPAATDYSHAPPQARRTPDAPAVTSPILVLGDGMADWLAYGLEDAFAEKPEFGIVRKHRAWSGLVRYDPKRDVEWPQIAREAIAAEKPKFVVMMVGYHDRQAIRERGPAAPARPGAQPAPSPNEDAEYHEDPNSPESRARASAEQQNAEMQKAAQTPSAQPSGDGGARQPQPAAAGPMEFQSEAWQAAYVRRLDAAIAALKSANVPVFWVGLPPQRDQRLAAAAVYLNDLYRARAERAGIIYIDIWDGFVDEAGRYVLQGPDFEGQIRRLRSGDGVYFTRAGARKLAHYVEREILRSLLNTATPVALPAPEPAQPQSGKPGGPRPLAGPVIPLTASIGGGNELLGGAGSRAAGSDPLVTRVLVRGEAITAPAGRADNFVWPRGSAISIQEAEGEAIPAQPSALQVPQALPSQPARPAATTPVPSGTKGQPGEARPPVQRRAAPPRAHNDAAPRPRASNAPPAARLQ